MALLTSIARRLNAAWRAFWTEPAKGGTVRWIEPSDNGVTRIHAARRRS